MKLLIFVLALAWSGSALAQAPKEITLPVEKSIPLQVGETRIFQFGEAVNRVGISQDNILEAKSVEASSSPGNAFAFKGLAPGNVIVTARSEDGRELHRLQFLVGGRQVKIYSRDEPDYLAVNCDEFGCGPAKSSKRAPNSVTVRTPTGGGGFVDRAYQ